MEQKGNLKIKKAISVVLSALLVISIGINGWLCSQRIYINKDF